MEYVTLLSAEQLLRSEGLGDNRFPKSYPVKVSMGFVAYLSALGLFILYTTVINPILVYGGLQRELFAFWIVYSAFIIGWVIFQLPRAVVREVDAIVIQFLCRKTIIPLKDIQEVRIVHSLDCKSQAVSCKVCKFVWGFPTRLDKTVFVMTHSCCSNYQLGLADMEEFLRDNRPQPGQGDGMPYVCPSLVTMVGKDSETSEGKIVQVSTDEKLALDVSPIAPEGCSTAEAAAVGDDAV